MDYDKLFMKYLGEYFQELRQERRLTRKELSQFLKVNENTLFFYETGKRDMPLSLFKNLCLFFGKDYVETFNEIDKKASKNEK